MEIKRADDWKQTAALDGEAQDKTDRGKAEK